jgi:hypothetical protein
VLSSTKDSDQVERRGIAVRHPFRQSLSSRKDSDQVEVAKKERLYHFQKKLNMEI